MKYITILLILFSASAYSQNITITAAQARQISTSQNISKKQALLDDISYQIDATARNVDALSNNTVLNYTTALSDSTKSLNFINNYFTNLGYIVSTKWNIEQQRWTVKINW